MAVDSKNLVTEKVENFRLGSIDRI